MKLRCVCHGASVVTLQSQEGWKVVLLEELMQDGWEVVLLEQLYEVAWKNHSLTR